MHSHLQAQRIGHTYFLVSSLNAAVTFKEVHDCELYEVS